jgi:hypothetical protein
MFTSKVPHIYPTDYSTILALATRTRGKPTHSKNHRLIITPTSVEVLLHSTNILIYHNDNTLTITHGGWDTPMTAVYLKAYTSLPHLALSGPTRITLAPTPIVHRPRSDFTKTVRVPKLPEAMKGMSRQFQDGPYYLRNLAQSTTKRKYALRHHYRDAFKDKEVPYTGPEIFVGEPGYVSLV